MSWRGYGQHVGMGIDVIKMYDGAVGQIQAGGMWWCGSRWSSDGAGGEVAKEQRCGEIDN